MQTPSLVFLCPLKSSSCKILVKPFLLLLHWWHQQSGDTRKKTTCKNAQSAFRCGLRVIYTGSPDLHDRSGSAGPLIIVRSSILIWLFPISSVMGNKNHPQTFQSDTFWCRLEIKVCINSRTDLIHLDWTNEFTDGTNSIKSTPEVMCIVFPFKRMILEVIGNKGFVRRWSSRGEIQ